jgi:serine protease Do
MIQSNKKLFFLIGFLVFGLIAGSAFSPVLNASPSAQNQQKSKPGSKASTDPKVQELMTEISKAFEVAAARISPSVVPIFAEQVVKVQSPFGSPDDPFRDFFGDDFFKRFFGTPEQQEQKRVERSLGSGVIVTKDGYILTNNHVVQNADKVTVVLNDKKSFQAEIVGKDPQTDVAVIKIKAADLPAAALGDSEKVEVGQWVIAVGNPFQLMHTVTAGIISAKGRSMVGLADYEDFIQTDASINPGNSGGALADLDGNVIGINTAITSPSGGNIGIGFAIPINMARRVMDELISKGKVIRGYLGITLQDIDDNLAKALKLKSTEGALVNEVVPNGPAAKAGIKRGDVIVEFNGQKVGDRTELRNLAAQAKPKAEVKIGLLRNGKKMEVTAILAERPIDRTEEAPQKEQPEEQASKELGLSIQNLTPDIAQQLGYQNEHGVVVVDVASGSPADDAGLQQGDLIKEVNKVAIRTVQDFNRQIKGLKSGDSIAMLVRRGQTNFYVAIQIL